MIKSFFSYNSLNKTNRNLVVLPQHVGENVLVHNGKDFIKLSIIKEMISHKLGEFVKTRNLTDTKISQNKKKKNKTKNRNKK
jgi:ribosomal protein S19